ncbi:MAG: hypothetical protein L4877_00415 [Aigarchaeota archaeon]|nr:hypothetical protein [Candidatus Geocrenenecus dongiae]
MAYKEGLRMDYLSRMLTLILFIMLLLLVISLVIRFQRGLLGLALVIAVALLGLYWFKELKKAFTKQRAVEKYPVEILEQGDLILLTAQVPGPEEEVYVELRGKKLLLRGGGGFRRIVKLPYHTKIIMKSYLNGVLHLQLRKVSTLEEHTKS